MREIIKLFFKTTQTGRTRFFFRRLVVLVLVDTLDATDRETIDDAWLGACFLNKKSKLGRINSFFLLDIPALSYILRCHSKTNKLQSLNFFILTLTPSSFCVGFEVFFVFFVVFERHHRWIVNVAAAKAAFWARRWRLCISAWRRIDCQTAYFDDISQSVSDVAGSVVWSGTPD